MNNTSKKLKYFNKIICQIKKIMYLCTRFWFRSSVGLEQQPSKLWVLGSNPNGITSVPQKGTTKSNFKAIERGLLLNVKSSFRV